MADDIDHWLDQLAGRAATGPEHPLDQALVGALQAESAPVDDDLGLRRLHRRLEAEGLLNANTTRRHAPRWLAVAASLLVAVSLGWWMLPQQVLQEFVETPNVASTARELDGGRPMSADDRSSEPLIAAPVPPPAAQALPRSSSETATAPATPSPSREAQAAADAAVQHVAEQRAMRERGMAKSKAAAQSAFAATPPVVRLPEAGTDLQALRERLTALDGVQVEDWPPSRGDGLRVSWADAAARARLTAALPAGTGPLPEAESGQVILRQPGNGAVQ
ncbi:MAG: hypothetical protein CMP06_08240 [Xanthomonadales bacterium]|nr:hypothetical protein [Xanthomonadales bacterium]